MQGYGDWAATTGGALASTGVPPSPFPRSGRTAESAPARSRVRTRQHARRRAETGAPSHRHLAALLEDRAFVLHDCPTTHGAPTIDHLAVAESGVWVIASRRVGLQRVQLRHSLRSAPVLRVGQADRTELLDLLDRQRTLICGALADQPGVPIHTALSFAGGQFPFLGTLSTDGHLIVPPRELVARVGANGPLKRSRARALAAQLDERLGG